MSQERKFQILEVLNVQPSTLYLAEEGNFLKPIQIYKARLSVSSNMEQQLISSLEKGEKPEIEFYNYSGCVINTEVIQAEEIQGEKLELEIYIPLTSDQESSLHPPRFEAFEGN